MNDLDNYMNSDTSDEAFENQINSSQNNHYQDHSPYPNTNSNINPNSNQYNNRQFNNGDDTEVESLFDYSPRRVSKEHLEEYRSSFNSRINKKPINQKPPKSPKRKPKPNNPEHIPDDDFIDSQLIDDQLTDDQSTEIKNKKSRKSPKQNPPQDGPTEHNEQQGFFVKLKDRILIIITTIILIWILFFAVQHIVVNQIRNPKTYDPQLNPVTRFLNTIRGKTDEDMWESNPYYD